MKHRHDMIKISAEGYSHHSLLRFRAFTIDRLINAELTVSLVRAVFVSAMLIVFYYPYSPLQLHNCWQCFPLDVNTTINIALLLNLKQPISGSLRYYLLQKAIIHFIDWSLVYLIVSALVIGISVLGTAWTVCLCALR